MKGDWVFCRGHVVLSILQTLTEHTENLWGNELGGGAYSEGN